MQVAYAKNTRRPGRWREEAEKQSYGALNAIGGMNRSGRYIYSPWDHCLRPPIDPVYRGPCPPNPDGTDLEDVYGSFYQDGTLTLTWQVYGWLLSLAVSEIWLIREEDA